MDSLVASAARLLVAGDPLGALKRVALRDDPPALALRGIAMVQLGDYARARKLLRRAAHGFGPGEPLAQARCQVAEAEVALAARDLKWPAQTLDAAAQGLDALGDRANALHARLLGARRQLLVGKLEAAEQRLAAVDVATGALPPPLAARAELTRAELALRRVRVGDAAVALDRAMTTLEGRSKRRTHEHSSLLPDSDAGPIQRSSARVVVAPWTGNRRLDRPQRNAGPASQVPRLCRGVRGACNRSWHLHVSRCASADAASALMHRVVGVRCDKALAALHSARSRHPMGKGGSTMKSLNGIQAIVTGGATAV